MVIASAGDYALPADALPVATLVTESTMPPSTAPLEPTTTSNPNVASGIIYADEPVSRYPMTMTSCPVCNQESRTRVTTAPTWKTWTAGGCLFMVFWPVCWVPLVVDSCKQTNHYCVKCGARVAQVEAFQDCCVDHRE